MPDGIYTAPTDAALAYDIQMEKALGFNMVRKHIKVERQRWYYWADKLGVMVWQDMPSCNSYTGSPKQIDPLDFIAELTAMVTNHWNSPAIIMWDVFNEGQGQSETGQYGQTNTTYLCNLVKTLDPSRLVNQASGNNWVGAGDVADNHSYPDPGDPFSSTQAPVDGEFGGIAWDVSSHLWNPALAGNGYLLASSLDNFATLYDGYITEAVNYKTPANGGLNAAVYTQITDVENECNGLMTYDRLLKPDLNKIKNSNQKAITGTLYLTDVLPTSQNVGRAWSYTTSNTVNSIPANWYATNFDASSWNSGQAGFGTAGTPGAVVRTTWNNSNIWMRAQLTVGNLSTTDINSLVFNCFHDEDCEIYLNGVLAGSASGYSTSYVLLPMNVAGMNALILNGTNLIAVHCHQTTGGQGIDVGISKRILVANTFTVPTDEIGYWPLDATNGTIAVDVTWNGNNGAVNGATWNANGETNGCLSFNGINNSIQISNIISADFSITFWIKTTQTGGAGQWYNGAGLVDGDHSGFANDFGTALVGGQFGFGVGNPDTTIVSSNSINDGTWHHCVATRVQATGTISVYVDGRLSATGTGNANTLNASAALMFGQIASGGGYFNGSLDEIEIYNRALGANEVAALYYNGVYQPTLPMIMLPPASLTVPVGGSAIFTIQALGGNLNYQWSLGSTPIAGATNATLTLTNVALSDAGNYSILVSNTVGSASSSASLTVQVPTLEHRYSFTSDASDSVGGANATLVHNATVSGGVVHLPGGNGSVADGSYVQLPHGLLLGDNSVTIETWLTDNAGATWSEPWCIGGSTTAITGGTGNNYIGLIPHSSAPDLRAAFKQNGSEYDAIWSNTTLPLNTEEYVVVTYDASRQIATIYLNGVQVAVNNIPFTPASLGDTYDNFLGLDEFNDALFQGSIDEFRIWNAPVSPLYLGVSTIAGPNVVVTNLTPVSLAISVTNSSMTAGLTRPARVIGNFTDASGVPVTSYATNWTSSNPGVLTVNGSGLITAVNVGSATVSATFSGVTGTSSAITISTSGPVITQQPQASESLLAGATLNASVANIGNPPFTYRWYFNSGENPISTAATPALTIPSLQPGNAGSYTCLVSNQYGTALSLALNLTVVSPTTYEQSLLSLNPIAYWPLNENNGTVVHDLVGNYNGTYNGGFTLAQSGPTNSVFGSPSRSAFFDGTSAYVDIPEGPFNITGSMTTVAWVDVLTSPKFAGLFGNGDASWRMSVSSSGQPGASVGNATDATSSTSIMDGNWHMVAYTYTGISGINNGLLYVDAVLVASDSVTSPPLGNNLDVWIGGSPDYGTARLSNAKIAHAAVFTQALTAIQMQDLYTGTYAAPVNLGVTRSGLSVVLNWPAGVLLQALALTGPWITNSAAVSPYTVPAASGNQFFKLLVSP